MTQISPALLSILRCPETHQPLQPANPELIERLNQLIRSGELRNVAGELVRDVLEGALLREDRQRLFPIRRGIPIMLAEESIGLDSRPPLSPIRY